jgi:hypothetical protein
LYLDREIFTKLMETLNISHNNLSADDDNAGLTESFSTSNELHKVHTRMKTIF